MKISTKGRYAIEIIIDLALYAGDVRVSLSDIASRRGLSEKYLERIVKLLRTAGIIKSVRGAFGGYVLEREPESLTVLEILKIAEGELAPVQCLTQNGWCGIDCGTCATKSTWEQLWYVITASIKDITIADLLDQIKIEIKESTV